MPHKTKELRRQYIEEYTKKTVLKKRYGLSYEKYQEMIKNQNNQCAICHKHQSELKQILCVDHDHNTNKVRELLCNECNVALAAFENFDNRPFLEYLKKHREKLN